MRLLVLGKTLGVGGAQLQLSAVLGSLPSSEVEVVQRSLPVLGRLPLPLRLAARGAWANSVALRVNPDRILLYQTPSIVVGGMLLPRFRERTVAAERSNPFAQYDERQLRLLRRGMQASATRVVQTERLALRMEREWGLKCEVIPNFLSDVFQDPSVVPSRYTDCPPVVLYAGRLSRDKRLADLLDGFMALGEQFAGWTLRLVGSGPELDALRKHAAHCSPDRQIEFLPPVSQRELASHMASARVFVLPSGREGFPNSLREAALTTPCVVSADVDYGAREILAGRPLSRLYPVGDVEALVRAVESVVEEAALPAPTSEQLGAWIRGVRAQTSRGHDHWQRILERS